jgi:hypothetical protein
MRTEFRNISFATVDSFDEVLCNGAVVTGRDKDTKELRNRVTTLTRPMERCVFLPGRGNDVFAQIAETLWVLAGRNDLPWLTRYLTRAPEFSNDGGATWHGAYGPRLRNWHSVDQVDRCRQELLKDPTTRRAASVIFDPARDYAEKLADVPCNNWLNWLLRDGRLFLNVGIRSNDALWGFSGINAFEWSVLQEMMAHWIGAQVGHLTFFATSYHLYADKFEQARKVVDRFHGLSPYDFRIASARFATPWEEWQPALDSWFEAEESIRANPDATIPECRALRDPFLGSALRLVRLRWGAERWTLDRLSHELSVLPEDDFAAAAYEKLGRAHTSLKQNITQPKIRSFFEACESAKHGDGAAFKAAIMALHSRKNTSYGGAWKRRGERVSILPNLARKIDRLEALSIGAAQMDDETLFDTALDLYVYAVKYVLFLLEKAGLSLNELGATPPAPLSDHDGNFDAIVQAAQFAPSTDRTFAQCVGAIVQQFESLWRDAETYEDGRSRVEPARRLLAACGELLATAAAADPRSANAFTRSSSG